MSKADRDLTKGRVEAVLYRMSWPMVVGIVASMSVPISDAYFLGQIGTTPLAAISFAFPVVMTLMSLAIGVGSGASSVVSRAIGEGDEEKTVRVATASIVLSILLTALIAVIGYLTVTPLFTLLGASGEALEMVSVYMHLWYIGLPALAVMMVASNLLRAGGDSRSPAVMMVFVAAFNVGLNSILISGAGPVPQLGIEGAAYATLISRLATVIIAFWLIAFRDQLIDAASLKLQPMLRAWRQVAHVALPAAVGSAVNPFGITVVTAFVAAYGDASVAAFGTGSRIESFVAIPMLAMSAAVGPIAGQNFGKGEIERVRETLLKSYAFSALWSLLVAAVLFLAAPSIMALFTDDQFVIDTGALYLTIIPITLAGYGITVVASAAFNAMGKPVLGLTFYLIRTAALYVPLVWIASSLFDITAVFFAIALSNLIAGVLIAYLSQRELRKMSDAQ